MKNLFKTITLSNNMRGIVIMSLGLLCSICADFFVKMLVLIYPVSEITFLRSLTRVIVVGTIILSTNRKMFKSSHYGTHLLRAVFSVLTTISFFYAYQYNSFTEIYTISYSSVMFNIIFSVLILKEKISNKFFIAVMCGITGIFFAMKPDASKVFQIFSLLPLCGAILAALNRVLVKKLTFNDHPFTIALYSSIVTVSIMPIFGIYKGEVWTLITNHKHLTYLAFMGGLSVLSQFLIINAVKHSKNAFLAPCDYFTFIFVAIADNLIWGYSITADVFIGAMFIIVGNSYIIFNDYKRRKTIPTNREEEPELI